MYARAGPGAVSGPRAKAETCPDAAFAMPARSPRPSNARRYYGSEATSFDVCRSGSCSSWPLWLLGRARTPPVRWPENEREPRARPGRNGRNCTRGGSAAGRQQDGADGIGRRTAPTAGVRPAPPPHARPTADKAPKSNPAGRGESEGDARLPASVHSRDRHAPLCFFAAERGEPRVGPSRRGRSTTRRGQCERLQGWCPSFLLARDTSKFAIILHPESRDGGVSRV